MKKLRKATTALLAAVPSKVGPGGDGRPPSRGTAGKRATVGKRDRRGTPSPTAILVDTPDGIEAVPFEAKGRSPSTIRAWRVARRPTTPPTPAPTPGGAVVDSRDDGGGGPPCPPSPPRSPGLAGQLRTLSRHRTFLTSTEDDPARDAAVRLHKSRTGADRSPTLSAHGDFLASLEEDLVKDAAALIGGADPAEAGGVPSSTAVEGAISQSSPVKAPRQRTLFSANLGKDARVCVEDGPTFKRCEVHCNNRAKPGGSGNKKTVDEEDSRSLLLSSSWLDITSRQDSFVSALTENESTIRCGTIFCHISMPSTE